jgi:DNA-binding MarR family transcriptional regulator
MTGMPAAQSVLPVSADPGELLASELLHVFASIRRSTRRRADRPFELSDLTGAQLEFVRLVRRRPGISVADAARELRLAANTVSTLVRQLVELELLERSADESDRRVARLDLPAGVRRKVDAWRDRRTLVVDAAIAELSQRDRERLAQALPSLERLAERLEQAAA